MIWTIFGVVYVLSGTGVMLALDDEDDRKGDGFAVLLAALVVIILWPMFFMFAATICIRTAADGRLRQITNPRAIEKEQVKQ